jgi:hypothetical protein
MSVIDFLTVAPHTNAGKNLNTFIKSLKELSNQDSEAGRIAETLMLHVLVRTLMADGLFILFIEQQEKRSCSYYHKPLYSKSSS